MAYSICYYIRREWQGGHYSPRRHSAIIRAEGNTTGHVVEKYTGHTIYHYIMAAGAIAGSDTPGVGAVMLKTHWVFYGILPLNDSSPPAILKIIYTRLLINIIMYTPEIEPHMRELVNEHGAGIDIVRIINGFHLKSIYPFMIPFCTDGEGRRCQCQ